MGGALFLCLVLKYILFIQINEFTFDLVKAKKATHGGARQGAGRKKGEPKKMIWFSVPETIASVVREEIRPQVEKSIKKHLKPVK